MEVAVANLTEPGDHAVVAHTGYFSARMTEMLRRRGVDVTVVRAPFGKGRVLTISPHSEDTPGLENFVPLALAWLGAPLGGN